MGAGDHLEAAVLAGCAIHGDEHRSHVGKQVAHPVPVRVVLVVREADHARILERDLVVIDVHLVAEDRREPVHHLVRACCLREHVAAARVVPDVDRLEGRARSAGAARTGAIGVRLHSFVAHDDLAHHVHFGARERAPHHQVALAPELGYFIRNRLRLLHAETFSFRVRPTLIIRAGRAFVFVFLEKSG
jgi:hypothetical protein